MLQKPQLKNFIVISEFTDSSDGFQSRTINPKHVDLSVLSPDSHFLIFYGKASKALSEEKRVAEYRHSYCETYADFELFWRSVRNVIEKYAPSKDALRDELYNRFRWDRGDVLAFGSNADSNYNLFRHYLAHTNGKLLLPEQIYVRRAALVTPEREKEYYERRREELHQQNLKFAATNEAAFKWWRENRG